MHPAKPGVFYQNGGTFPNKDAIIDTKRINDCVLCFWRFQQRAAVVHGFRACQVRPQGSRGTSSASEPMTTVRALS